MRRTIVCFCSATFAVGKIYFSETFGDGWESRWTVSKWQHKEGESGKWVAGAGKYFRNEAEEKGLMTGEDFKHFGISASFDSFSNEGKELIIQYQVKLEQDLECGGSYMKIGPKMKDPTQFGDPTVYNIMFGPDTCGEDSKTHLIFHYKGKHILKKRNLPHKHADIGITYLYRMVLRPDNTVRVEVNHEKIYDGSLLKDWELLAPKTLDDTTDSKPTDWVDDAMMDDPEIKKPADWVDAKRIPDTTAKKPDDWDDADDGPWEFPKKDNPEYIGEWIAERIHNPEYKGKWKPRQLPNPEYVHDDHLYKYEDFGFVGFDLWQVRGGTIFDNIIITDDMAEAEVFARKWSAMVHHERTQKDAEEERKRKEKKAKGGDDVDDDDDLDEENWRRRYEEKDEKGRTREEQEEM